MTPRRSGPRASPARGRWSTQAGGAERIAGDRHHQPARDDRLLDAADRARRWRRRSSGRTGAPPSFARGSRQQGHEEAVQAKTGLLLDPYFSASKIAWALAHWPQLRRGGRRSVRRHGRKLAGLPADRRPPRHRRDQRLAHRADGHRHGPLGRGAARPVRRARARRCPRSSTAPGRSARPCPSMFGGADPDLRHGRRPAGGGDRPGLPRARRHQGDLRHRRLRPHPYRRRARRVSQHRLLSTIAWQLGGERRYALEGSVFVAGSLIKWLRDELGLIASAAESEALARSVPDSGGVQIVPALAGLGAPHWRPDARGAIIGPQLRHRPRPYRPRRARGDGAPDPRSDDRLRRRRRAPGQCLKIDGGMAANDWLAQDLADMLDLTVERPAFVETTALGAAMLAGVGCGLFALARGSGGDARRGASGSSRRWRRRRASAGWRAGGRRWRACCVVVAGKRVANVRSRIPAFAGMSSNPILTALR